MGRKRSSEVWNSPRDCKRVALGGVCGLALSLCAYAPAEADDGAPIDPAKLAVIRQHVENYLSRVQTYHVMFNIDIYATKGRDVEPPRSRAQHEFTVRVSDGAFRNTMIPRSPDGRLTDSINEMSFASGRETRLNRSHNNSVVKNVASSGELSISPMCAVGLPLYTTKHTPLSALLLYPELTTDLGTEMINGNETIVLKIGPGIPPDAIEGHPLWPTAWVKLWIAPRLSYMPVRTWIFGAVLEGRSPASYTDLGIEVLAAPNERGERVNYHKHAHQVREVREVPDEARGDTYHFPWAYESVSGATCVIVCEEASINVSIDPETFNLLVPPDFGVVQDSKLVRAHIAGENAVTPGGAPDTELRPQAELQPPLAAAYSENGAVIPWLLGIGAVIFLGTGTFLWRRHCES